MVGLILAIPIGALLVLLGAGGSILMVPALVYGGHLDVHQAAGTSLLVVALVAVAGAAAKHAAIDIPTAVVVGAAGVAGAWGGAWLNHQTADTVILAAFAGTLLIAAVGMARPARSRPHPMTRSTTRALGCGTVLGVATGFFGVGGGFLIVPALMLFLGLRATVAVATSLAIIAFNSVGGLIGHAIHGAVQWRLGLTFAGAALLGAAAAVPMARHVSGHALQRAFAGLLGAVGVGMLVQVVARIVS